MSIERNEPLFTNPLEAVRGLTINDLNKYLPAVQKVEDISMTADQIKDGVFLGLCLDGLKKIPDSSIDLIIADPPESPWRSINQRGKPMTIQEYFQWNENWLDESSRVLKPTGAIYLICGWRYSGMYHSLLSNNFQIQTRITWRNISSKDQPKPMTWINRTSDIWYASKTKEFMFNQVLIRGVDFTIQEFTNANDLAYNLEKGKLVPVPGIKIALDGSRHFMISKKHKNGEEVFEALEKGLKILRDAGIIDKYLTEAGFYRKEVASWKTIRVDQ